MMVGENSSVSDEAMASSSERSRTKCDVGVDGEAGGGQNAGGALDVVAVEADALGQLQPALDAARALGRAVVVDQPPAPFAAQFAGRQAGRSGSRPSPGSGSGNSSGSAPRPAPGRGSASRRAAGGGTGAGCGSARRRSSRRAASRPSGVSTRWRMRLGHTVDLHDRPRPPPSRRARPSARSGESSSRTGLVLLMWIRILRGTPSVGEGGHACRSGRPRLIWPMRRPVLAPSAGSDHLVVAPQRAVEEHQRRAAADRARAPGSSRRSRG